MSTAVTEGDDVCAFDPCSLAIDAHARFIVAASSAEDTLEHAFTEHLRLSGMYWGLCALSVMGKLDALGDAKREEILDYVERCLADRVYFTDRKSVV